MPHRFTSLLPSLISLAACAAAPAPRSPPANTPIAVTDASPTLDGSYSEPHTVLMVCEGGDDGWCEESVEDTMNVAERPDGSLDVDIALVQTNGHTCSFAGHLSLDTAARAHRWIHHSDDAGDGPCTLTLDTSPTALRLQSEGCRYYCGARATLDATFTYPPRT